MNRKKMSRYDSSDPTYASFFILGGLWIMQFCCMFIDTIVSASEGPGLFAGVEYGVGVGHAVVLLVAAYEDLRFGTSHTVTAILLAVGMNFIIGLLASLSVWFLIAVVIAVIIGGGALAAGGEALVVFLTTYLFAGGAIGTILLILLIIGLAISSLIGLSHYL